MALERDTAAHREAADRMSGPTPQGLEENLPARSRIISPSLLLPAESVIFELKPSLWYVPIVSLPIAAAGVAVVVLALFIQEIPDTWRHWGVVIGVWTVGLRLVLGMIQWIGRTYVLTDRRILKQHGVINVRVECVGLEEIENTFVAKAAFQKLVGIGTIFFRCNRSRRDTHAWEHVARPKEIHAHIVAQIDRWQKSISEKQ
jgi:hypothetical protein